MIIGFFVSNTNVFTHKDSSNSTLSVKSADYQAEFDLKHHMIIGSLNEDYNPSLYLNSGNNSLNTYNEINPNLPKLRNSQTSNKIYINNNWTAAKAAGICTGSGIFSDPYVIEDLEIDAGDSGSCILIENSNAYFKIENCTLINSGYYHSGITLKNVSNSQLISNYCWADWYGIRLIACNNNTIRENVVSYSDITGVYLEGCDNNNVSENTANYCDYIGIQLINCKNHVIARNVVNNNLGGIYLHDSDNNAIFGNIIKNNRFGDWGSGYGVLLFRCDKNFVLGNSISNNNGGGISLRFESCFNVIFNNTLNGNGVTLEHSNCFNLVFKNTIKNSSHYGIVLYYESNFNIIIANQLIDNPVCIRENNCFENIYYDNSGCYYIGFSLLKFVIVIIVGITLYLKTYLKTKNLNKCKRKERDGYKISDWLGHQYYKLGKSLQDIANEQGVSMITIRNWLDKLEKN